MMSMRGLAGVEPSDPAWEFSFAGVQMFVVGCGPTYQRRQSRNLGKGIVMLFQPRSVFVDAVTDREISLEARQQVRRRLLAWDDMMAHPDLGIYGDPDNLEWKQYFLSDDTTPEAGVCPFREARRGSAKTGTVLSAAPSPETDWPRNPGGVVARLRHWAVAAPDRIAVRFLIDGVSKEACLTYAELDARCRALAGTMLANATVGDRALLSLPSGPDYIVAFFACLYARIVAVPAFREDASARRHAARVASIVADCDPRIILTNGEDLHPGMSPHRIVIDTRTAVQGWLVEAPLPTKPGDLAFLQYTSGSTAAPKGVMVTHGNLDANLGVLGDAWKLSQADVMASWLPLYHDMGLIGGVLAPIYFGFPLILMSPHHFLGSPMRWLQAISRYHATVGGAPDFSYQLCLDRVNDERARDLDLSAWRVAWCGAEPIRTGTMQGFAARFAMSGLRTDALQPLLWARRGHTDGVRSIRRRFACLRAI